MGVNLAVLLLFEFSLFFFLSLYIFMCFQNQQVSNGNVTYVTCRKLAISILDHQMQLVFCMSHTSSFKQLQFVST